MFFKGLPEELNPGRLQLTPLDRAVRFIIPCDACNDFTPKRIIVSCGHVFCSSCCTTWRTPIGSQFHCVICNERSDGETSELSETLLRRLKCACSCGFQGTLAEIREHAWNSDVQHRLGDEARDRPTTSVKEENIINALREQLQILRVADTPELNRTKAYFCVELLTKIEDRDNGNGCWDRVDWTAAGYPISFFCDCRTSGGKTFLGVFVQTHKNRPSFSTWPMKKNITFELYNLKGESVKSCTLATFRDGEPTDERFALPCNIQTGFGFPKFYTVDDLTAPRANILRNGHACFSVEFKDLGE